MQAEVSWERYMLVVMAESRWVSQRVACRIVLLQLHSVRVHTQVEDLMEVYRICVHLQAHRLRLHLTLTDAYVGPPKEVEQFSVQRRSVWLLDSPLTESFYSEVVQISIELNSV